MTSEQAAGTPLRHVPVIGLVGGIGSGKSTLARWIAAQTDALLIDADAIGHGVLKQEAVREELCREFGHQILTETGDVDRSRLAQLVFGEETAQQQARQRLERIVHPAISAEIAKRIHEGRAHATCPMILLDAAVLLEAGWQELCDCIVFVETPLDLRRQRAESRGWSAEEHRRREASQWDLDRKRQAADFSVANDGSLEFAGHEFFDRLTAYHPQTMPVLERLRALADHTSP